MLLRISLIIAILAGIAVIVVTQFKVREHVQGIIQVRDENIEGRAKEKDRADRTEKWLAVTNVTLKTTQDNLAKTTTELNTTKTRVAEAENRVKNLSTELATTKGARDAAQQKLAQWDIIGLNPDQVKTVINNLKKAEELSAVLEDEKTILTREIRKLRNDIAMLVGTNADYEAPLPLGLKGKVVAVDPRWNFVVLDIGDKDGALPQGVMLVHRDSKLVGKVRLLNVLPNRSIANVVNGWRLEDIHEGDQVLF